jgi:opacity protein-like surface antigen
MLTRPACVAALVMTLLPSAAHADWLFSPAVAFPFAADTLDRSHTAYGVTVGVVDEEFFGVEAELGYAPRFFNGNRQDFTGTGNVITLMGNILVGRPAGRLVPYLTAGAGYMQMRVTSDAGTFTTTTREVGFNAGAGVIAFPVERVGVRGDLRYIRSFQNQDPSWTRGVDVDIAPGAFDFWRASLGVTIRLPE